MWLVTLSISQPPFIPLESFNLLKVKRADFVWWVSIGFLP